MLEHTFADIVGKARFGKGWSTGDLARRIDCSEQQIERLEEGTAPTDEEIERLAATLGLDSRKLAYVARSAWRPLHRDPIPMLRSIDGRIGNYPVNGYLFFDSLAWEGVLFDTGYSPDQVFALLQKENIRLVALCVTHAHPDHIGGADRIHAATRAPMFLDVDECQEKRLPAGAVFLEKGKEIMIGRYRVGHRHSPGHTPGGTTFLIEPVGDLREPIAFVGDALFAGSLGRAQSPETYPLLLRSVKEAILSLPKETRLFPGHGPPTTVGEERDHNPFFTDK